jgi:hypothetical protein
MTDTAKAQLSAFWQGSQESSATIYSNTSRKAAGPVSVLDVAIGIELAVDLAISAVCARL